MGRKSHDKRIAEFHQKTQIFDSDENALALRRPFALFQEKIATADSVDKLYNLYEEFSDTKDSKPEPLLADNQLNRRDIKRLKELIRKRAPILISRQTCLGTPTSRSDSLAELRAQNESGEFTHSYMLLLVAVISHAEKSECLPFLYKALQDKRFYRDLRQPEKCCWPSKRATWQIISELCGVKKRPKAMSDTELTESSHRRGR
jgi:hypothetical protein